MSYFLSTLLITKGEEVERCIISCKSGEGIEVLRVCQ